MAAETLISCTILTEDDMHVTRAAEVLGRAAAGLALEGINVTVNICQPGDSEE